MSQSKNAILQETMGFESRVRSLAEEFNPNDSMGITRDAKELGKELPIKSI